MYCLNVKLMYIYSNTCNSHLLSSEMGHISWRLPLLWFIRRDSSYRLFPRPYA